MRSTCLDPVSRRDRSASAICGGILTLRRQNFNGVVHISDCVGEERSWHFLLLGEETILLGSWHRSGSSAYDIFKTLHEEIDRFYHEISSILIAGDLNIHLQKMTRILKCKYCDGNRSKNCDYYDMCQSVREPTRNEYLLHLALTAIQILLPQLCLTCQITKACW